MIKVIKTAVEKSGWDTTPKHVYQGFAYYYCHISHMAEVASVEIKNSNPVVTKVTCMVDCILINSSEAKNQA
jgi:isoquinoline 1-oxidoreductase beta subunit